MAEGKAWHDLYWHGQNLAYVCKSFKTQFKNAEDRDDYAEMKSWGEALRKTTVNCVDIAKVVLGVEEIVKRKKVYQ